MPNVAPATATITSTTGPGQVITAGVFTNVVNFEVDFNKNTIKLTWNGGLNITFFDYSAVTTFTWVVSGGLTTLTIS